MGSPFIIDLNCVPQLLQLCNKLNTITTIGDKELIRIESVEPGGEVSRQSLVINRHEKAAKV